MLKCQTYLHINYFKIALFLIILIFTDYYTRNFNWISTCQLSIYTIILQVFYRVTILHGGCIKMTYKKGGSCLGLKYYCLY